MITNTLTQLLVPLGLVYTTRVLTNFAPDSSECLVDRTNTAASFLFGLLVHILDEGPTIQAAWISAAITERWESIRWTVAFALLPILGGSIFALQVTILASRASPSIGTFARSLVRILPRLVPRRVCAPVKALGPFHAVRAIESRGAFAFAVFCIGHHTPVLAGSHLASLTAPPFVIPRA